MIESIDTSLVDWSRAQFALTAMYHWLFVPLTLGLAVVMGVMETLYYLSGNQFWKNTAKFWMKLFGINFAIGVATGIILEFEFGTNWSNYSWFVGDIFGAPLAIEGILAFFMEATFIAVMFFGWEKVSKGFHLASTWLTGLGATISAWWILVANAWMQYPVGMTFNPETVRNEMESFTAVAFSPVAVSKFCHTVISSWMVGAAFVVGVSCWYLIKRRHKLFALASIRIGATVGLIASLLAAYTGDISGVQMAKIQPMKLAAVEGLERGGTQVPLTLVPGVQAPGMLSLLATHNFNGYVPGIDDLLAGNYRLADGSIALSAEEKIERGKRAIQALSQLRAAQKVEDNAEMATARKTFEENVAYFGYGYIKNPTDLVPNVGLLFWSFRIMVGVGLFAILFFGWVLFLAYRKLLVGQRWLYWVGIWSIPLVYMASQSGWIVAEVGRQPWAIQDLLPVGVAISKLPTSSVQLTFFIFVVLFTILLIAEIRILLKAIQKGPEKVR